MYLADGLCPAAYLARTKCTRSLRTLILGVRNNVVVDHHQDEDQRSQNIGEKPKVIVVYHLQKHVFESDNLFEVLKGQSEGILAHLFGVHMN